MTEQELIDKLLVWSNVRAISFTLEDVLKYFDGEPTVTNELGEDLDTALDIAKVHLDRNRKDRRALLIISITRD